MVVALQPHARFVIDPCSDNIAGSTASLVVSCASSAAAKSAGPPLARARQAKQQRSSRVRSLQRRRSARARTYSHRPPIDEYVPGRAGAPWTPPTRTRRVSILLAAKCGTPRRVAHRSPHPDAKHDLCCIITIVRPPLQARRHRRATL